MEDVYAYLRVSSAQQSIENSFEYQRSAIENYCNVNGFRVIQYFTDEAKSGTTLKNRVGLDRLIKKSKEKSSSVKKIIIFKLERMFRSTLDGLVSINELMENGFEVISTQENLKDDFSLQLNLILAERYSSQLSGYTISSMSTLAKNHQKYLGGKVLFGYMIDDEGHYVRHPTNSKAVQMIFELFSQYKSYDYICKYLNDLHLYNSKGQPWEPKHTSIYSILKNPRYYGLYRYGYQSKSKFHKMETIEIENGCEAIVSKELFDKCSQILESRRHHNAKFTAKQVYLLSCNSLVKCGVCGKNMHGENHGANNYSTYRCKLKSKCSNLETNSKYVDKLGVQILSKFLKDKQTVKAITKQVNDYIAKSNLDDSAIKVCEDQLNRCETSIANLINAIESGLLSENIKNKLHEQEQMKAELETKLIQKKKEYAVINEVNETQIRALLNEAKLMLNDGDEGELKELIRLFYSKITIDRDKIVYYINLSKFFDLGYDMEEKALTFERNFVVKYKGNLNKIMFRQNQAKQALIS